MAIISPKMPLEKESHEKPKFKIAIPVKSDYVITANVPDLPMTTTQRLQRASNSYVERNVDSNCQGFLSQRLFRKKVAKQDF